MQIYLVNAVLIIIYGLLSGIPKQVKARKIARTAFVIVSFLQLWFIVAFRENVGHDYSMYIQGFYKMALDGFDSLSYKDWEIGYIVLNKVIAYFGVNQRTFLIVTSALSLIGPAFLVLRYSKKPLVSIMLYMNLFFYYISFNYIRQAIAISIICFAWPFIRKKKFIPFIIIVLIASLFHMTALIMLVVYVMIHFKPSVRTVLVYCYMLLFYYILSDGLIDILFSHIHTEYENSIFITNGINFFYSLIPVLFCILFFIAYKFMGNLSADTEKLISMCFFGMFWFLVMTRHSLFERFSYYSLIFIILAVPEVMDAFKKWLPGKIGGVNTYVTCGDTELDKLNLEAAKRRTKARASSLYMITYFCVIAVTLGYHMYGLLSGTSGVHGVVPYTCFFEFLNF